MIHVDRVALGAAVCPKLLTYSNLCQNRQKQNEKSLKENMLFKILNKPMESKLIKMHIYEVHLGTQQ